MSAWAQQTSGTAQDLVSVWGFAANDVFACGAADVVLHWNGSAWSSVTTGLGEQWSAVWGPNTNSVYVFSQAGRIAHSTNHGATWTDLGSNMVNTNQVYGVWGTSDTNIYAVQANGVYQKSGNGGASWTQLYVDPNSVEGPIRGFDQNTIYSVGQDLEWLLEWNGSTWVPHDQPGVDFIDVWPDTSSTGYAVDDAHKKIWRFTSRGKTLTAQNLPDSDFTPSTVYGDTPALAYAAGVRPSTGKFRVLKYDGANAWIDDLDGIPVVSVTQMYQLWVDPTSAYAVAVGATGHIFAKPAPALELLSAAAVATNTVRVVLSTFPLAQSFIGVGDALNPNTWSIVRTDTGAAFDVMTVNQVSARTFDLVIYERFASSLVQHQVSSTALVDPFSNLIQSPTSQTFIGVVAVSESTQNAKTAANRYALTDLANPPFPSRGSNVGGGTRVITASGDFASESGNSLVQKLVLRRLTTSKGGFFHLPDYGVGIQPKRPIQSNDLLTLKKQIEDQVALEPEVSAVSANLSLDLANDILTIVLQVRTNLGQQMTISTQLSTAGQPF